MRRQTETDRQADKTEARDKDRDRHTEIAIQADENGQTVKRQKTVRNNIYRERERERGGGGGEPGV